MINFRNQICAHCVQVWHQNGGYPLVIVFTTFFIPSHFDAGVFASFGLSGIIPAIHYGLMEGWFNKISRASLGWLVLMGKQLMSNIPNELCLTNTYTFQVCCTFWALFSTLCEYRNVGSLENSIYGYDSGHPLNRTAIHWNWNFYFSFHSFSHIKYSMCW